MGRDPSPIADAAFPLACRAVSGFSACPPAGSGGPMPGGPTRSRRIPGPSPPPWAAGGCCGAQIAENGRQWEREPLRRRRVAWPEDIQGTSSLLLLRRRSFVEGRHARATGEIAAHLLAALAGAWRKVVWWGQYY